MLAGDYRKKFCLEGMKRDLCRTRIREKRTRLSNFYCNNRNWELHRCNIKYIFMTEKLN